MKDTNGSKSSDPDLAATSPGSRKEDRRSFLQNVAGMLSFGVVTIGLSAKKGFAATAQAAEDCICGCSCICGCTCDATCSSCTCDIFCANCPCIQGYSTGTARSLVDAVPDNAASYQGKLAARIAENRSEYGMEFAGRDAAWNKGWDVVRYYNDNELLPDAC